MTQESSRTGWTWLCVIVLGALLGFGACTSNPTPHPAGPDAWGSTNGTDTGLRNDLDNEDYDTSDPEAPNGGDGDKFTAGGGDATDADDIGDSDDVGDVDDIDDADDAYDDQGTEAAESDDDGPGAAPDHFGAHVPSSPPSRVEDNEDSSDDD